MLTPLIYCVVVVLLFVLFVFVLSLLYPTHAVSVSGLSILFCLFGFPWRFIVITLNLGPANVNWKYLPLFHFGTNQQWYIFFICSRNIQGDPKENDTHNIWGQQRDIARDEYWFQQDMTTPHTPDSLQWPYGNDLEIVSSEGGEILNKPHKH